MGNLGGIEKVMVFGILVIILAILGIAVFSASNIDDDYQTKSEEKSPLNSYFMQQSGSSPGDKETLPPLKNNTAPDKDRTGDTTGTGGDGTVEVEEPFGDKKQDETVFGPGGIYKIKEGDTIIGIARRVYGDERMSQAILDANPGINPRMLKVDDTINLPEKRDAETKKTASASTESPAKQGYYKVQEKDTLYSIAEKFYKNKRLWTKIYNANRDKIQNPDFLTVGMELQIP